MERSSTVRRPALSEALQLGQHGELCAQSGLAGRGRSDLATASAAISIGDLWQMQGEVQQPDTSRQVRRGMAAVCKTVGYPTDFRFSIVMRVMFARRTGRACRTPRHRERTTKNKA